VPFFTYKARDSQGSPIGGIVEAKDELTVAGNLRTLGFSVISIVQQSQTRRWLSDALERIRNVSQEDIILFSRQLSTMLAAGLPLTNALASLIEQVRSSSLKEAISAVLRDVESGTSLSEALNRHQRIFNELFVSMVSVGETAGILDQVLERLAVLNEQELDLRMRIRSAVSYPVILVIVAVTVVSFLLVAIIPKFVTIFETYDTKLPLATLLLLGISNLVRRFWYLLIAALAAGFIWLRNFLKTEQGRYAFDSWLLKIPLWGQFYLKIIISRFCRTLGVLIKSGVPILKSLSVTEKTVSNTVIRRIIRTVRLAITEGQSLAEPFRASGVFPQMVVQMIAIGEKSGKMDQALIDVAAHYDRETEYVVKNITVILEPLLLVVMGGVVAFIALSVLLPIFNLIKVFRRGI